MSNTVHNPVSLHDVLTENTKMLVDMIGSVERLYSFFFGSVSSDIPEACRDQPIDCMMAEVDNQHVLLERCLNILTNTFAKLGS